MKRVCLGKIVAAHGIKGLVKIQPFGEDVTLLQSLSPLYVDEYGDKRLDIALKNPMGQYILAAVENVDNRTAAEALRGTELWVEAASLPKIEQENVYYYADLIGLKVIDETGAPAGVVLNVQNFGAGDLLEIGPPSGESYYVPFRAQYVLNIQADAVHIRKLDLKDWD